MIIVSVNILKMMILRFNKIAKNHRFVFVRLLYCTCWARERNACEYFHRLVDNVISFIVRARCFCFASLPFHSVFERAQTKNDAKPEMHEENKGQEKHRKKCVSWFYIAAGNESVALSKWSTSLSPVDYFVRSRVDIKWRRARKETSHVSWEYFQERLPQSDSHEIGFIFGWLDDIRHLFTNESENIVSVFVSAYIPFYSARVLCSECIALLSIITLVVSKIFRRSVHLYALNENVISIRSRAKAQHFFFVPFSYIC